MKESKRALVALCVGVVALSGLTGFGLILNGCSDSGGGGAPAGVDVTETAAAMGKFAVEGTEMMIDLELPEFPTSLNEPAKLSASSKMLGKMGVTRIIDRYLKGGDILAATESADCSGGGNVSVSCDSDASGSVVRLVANNCREEIDTDMTMQVDGEVVIVTDDPEACANGLGSSTNVEMTFSSFTMNMLYGGSLVGRIRLSGTLSMVEEGPVGCDEYTSGELFADYRLELYAPGEEVNLVITADNLTIGQVAGAAPCSNTFTLNGSLTVVDRVEGDTLGQSFDDFVISVVSDATDTVTMDGRATSSCVGAIDFETITPIDLSGDCPTAGQVNATVVETGVVSSITFTETGGVTLVYDVGGEAEETRELASCDDIDPRGSCR